MPVRRGQRLGMNPRFIQHLHDLVRQRSFLQVLQVALELRFAAYTNDDSVSSVFGHVERRVVHYPTQGNLQQGKLVLLRNLLDHFKRAKGRVSEVTLAIVLSGGRFGSKSRILVVRKLVLGLDLAGEETSSEGVVYDHVDTVAMAGGDRFNIEIAS
jgi:hypothetical protein